MFRLQLDADDMHAVATKVLALTRLADVAIKGLTMVAGEPRGGAVVEVVVHGDGAAVERLACRVGQVVGVTNLSLTSAREGARAGGDKRRPDMAETVAWA